MNQLSTNRKNIHYTTKINKAISKYKKQQNLQQAQSQKQSYLLTLSSEKTQQATKKIIVQCITTKKRAKMICFNLNTKLEVTKTCPNQLWKLLKIKCTNTNTKIIKACPINHCPKNHSTKMVFSEAHLQPNKTIKSLENKKHKIW